MNRKILLIISLVWMVSGAGTSIAKEVTNTEAGNRCLTEAQVETTLEEAKPGNLLLAAGCCKICRKGKACGDSCISRDKTCHQPPGCACDG